MQKHKAKIQRIINEVEFMMCKNDIKPTFVTSLKLQLLGDSLEDYFAAKEIIKKRGEIVEYNKGTTIAANPMFKIKNDAFKQVIKLLKELFKSDDNNDNAEEFINSLVS